MGVLRLAPADSRVTAGLLLGVPLLIVLAVVATTSGGRNTARLRPAADRTPAAPPVGSGRHPGSATAGPATSAPRPSDAVVERARALNQLLDLDQPARQAVAAAVHDVGECGHGRGFAADQAALTSVAADRDRLAGQALALPTTAVPDGDRAAQALAGALRAAASADRRYAAWAAAVAAADYCDPATAMSGPAFDAAEQASAAATAAKQAFLALWAPLARAASLPARTVETI